MEIQEVEVEEAEAEAEAEAEVQGLRRLQKIAPVIADFPFRLNLAAIDSRTWEGRKLRSQHC
jgi:hypothetical protein